MNAKSIKGKSSEETPISPSLRGLVGGKKQQLKADKSDLYGYSKKLKGFARANRNSMTKAEACLWKYTKET